MRYSPDQSEPIPMQGELLPIDRVIPRPSLHFVHEQGTLQALADSIRAYGLIRPILVQRTRNERYLIVSGNRRLMACRMLGMSRIRARVLAGDAQCRSREQLIGALRSGALHYLEEADALCALHDHHGMSRGELANLLRLHPRALMERMQMARFDDELRALLMDEGVPAAIAVTLLRVSDSEARMDAACRIARERLCVRDAALLAASAGRWKAIRNGATKRENDGGEEKSRIHTRNVIGVMRDQRPFLNAIRNIAGQMCAAGVDATLREERVAGRWEMTISVSTRRRRAARYQSM